MEKYLPLFILLCASAVIYSVLYFAGMPLIKKFVERTPNEFDDLLVEKNVVSRFMQLIPAMLVSAGLSHVLPQESFLYDILYRAANIWFVLIAFLVSCAFLNVIEYLNDKNEKTASRPMKGIFQVLKLLAFCISIVLIVSQVSGKTPVFILSALGAAATVLILIFRDSILGVVSGLQINMSDLLRKGDWIEIERHHADGTVIDITLTSVKIRNWDKTISVIPAYDLITNSFKNWRGMVDSGGRRIKRSLFIDVESIRFLTNEEIERLSSIDILRPYLLQKESELKDENAPENKTRLNNRHLTNIGTFRAYCNAYLRHDKKIHQKMTLMTRQLAPTPEGLPLEIYAFLNITNWEAYEDTQSDIFDHLIAAIPEFGLKLFQYPTKIGKILN